MQVSLTAPCSPWPLLELSQPGDASGPDTSASRALELPIFEGALDPVQGLSAAHWAGLPQLWICSLASKE